MNGIELRDREFFAAISGGREPLSSLRQVLGFYRVLDQIETQIPTPEEPLTGMAWVSAGSAEMGVKPLFPAEQTTKQSKTAGIWMSLHEVTIAQFARFIETTGYVTSAERTPKAEDHPDIAQELLVPGGAVFTSQ